MTIGRDFFTPRLTKALLLKGLTLHQGEEQVPVISLLDMEDSAWPSAYPFRTFGFQAAVAAQFATVGLHFADGTVSTVTAPKDARVVIDRLEISTGNVTGAVAMAIGNGGNTDLAGWSVGLRAVKMDGQDDTPTLVTGTSCTVPEVCASVSSQALQNLHNSSNLMISATAGFPNIIEHKRRPIAILKPGQCIAVQNPVANLGLTVHFIGRLFVGQ